MNTNKKYYSLISKATKMLCNNKLEKGHALIKDAQLLIPDKYEANVLLGVYYDFKRDFSLSLRNYEIALEKNPNSASEYFSLGHCLSLMGRKMDAINNLKKAINLDPMIKESYHLLIPELSLDGRQSDAYGYLLEAINLHPEDGTINFLMANELIYYHNDLRVNLTDIVLKYLDKAENKGMNPFGINNLRGDYFYQIEDWKNAEKYYLRSLKQEYNEDTARMYLAALLELKRDDEICEVVYAMKEQGSEYAKELMEEYSSCFVKA
jgi:tetratricopeptide (TPR) repeat protein